MFLLLLTTTNDDAAEATLCPTCDEELRKCWMCAMLGDPG